MDASRVQIRQVGRSGITSVNPHRFMALVISGNTFGSVFLFYCLFIVIFYISGTYGAITNQENNALSQILIAFPDLSDVAHWRRFSNGIDYGRSWTNNFDSLCQQGDGYEYYGVYCFDGHVGGLFIGSAMGHQMSYNFSEISGLSFLTNLTMSAFSFAGENFVKTVINTLPIQNLEAPDLKLNSSDFFSPAALQYLHIQQHNGFNITDFVGLRTLIVRSDVLLLGTFPSNLQVLSFDPPVISWTRMTSLLAALPNIKSFSSIVSLDSVVTTAGEAILRTESLESLRLSINSPNAVNIIIESDSLSQLQINIMNPQQGNFSTPNLTSLVLTGRLPEQFATFTKLEYLRYRGPTSQTPPQDFPDLDFLPRLKTLELVELNYDDGNLTRILCSAATYSLVFEALQLSYIENQIPTDLNIPECLSLSSSLRKVEILGFSSPVTAYNATSFFQNLPTSLTSLTLFNIFASPVPLSDFYKFAYLKSLRINGAVTGEIPPDFFSSLSELRTISLEATTLNGTLPSTNWDRLIDFKIEALQIDWPDLGPAPLLETLSISAQHLITLPTESSFRSAGLDSLRSFSVSGTILGATLPTFWAHLPNISSVLLGDLNLAGTLPSSISAPKLQQLHLSRNALCGPLPEILAPIQLENLDLSFNQLSVTIPTSWEANLTIIYLLSLESNFLDGTIPPHFLDHHGYQLSSIALSDNDFTGPLWKMSRGAPKSLYAINTGLEMCGLNPEIYTGLTMFCAINNITECSISRCDTYWMPCGGFTCSERTFVPRSVPPCSAIPETPLSPTSDNTCPPPRPSGFDCIGGQWVSPGPISEPSITLPPNSGIIIVNGNLSTGGSIVFDGVGTTLEVQGCVEILPNLVVIEIKGTEKLKPATLLTQKGSNCTSDLSLIPVKVDQQNDSCKKTTASTSESTKAALHVIFRLDSSNCNVKWIILGSVLGGVIIICAIVSAVLYQKSARCRKLVRSCNAKKASQ